MLLKALPAGKQNMMSDLFGEYRMWGILARPI
jgi:hypothetical protein